MSDKLNRIRIPRIMDAEIEVDENMVASEVAEYLENHPIVAKETDPTVTLMLIDSEGHVIENKHLTTAYVAPSEGE